jgi:diacylglycerol kinase family enzyme
VVMTGETTKRHFLRSLPKVFKGTHLDEPSVSVFKGRTVEVSADRHFVMYADGDPLAELPCSVQVRPRSLHVVVPRG